MKNLNLRGEHLKEPNQNIYQNAMTHTLLNVFENPLLDSLAATIGTIFILIVLFEEGHGFSTVDTLEIVEDAGDVRARIPSVTLFKDGMLTWG